MQSGLVKMPQGQVHRKRPIMPIAEGEIRRTLRSECVAMGEGFDGNVCFHSYPSYAIRAQ
jgi:hypothetical protein